MMDFGFCHMDCMDGMRQFPDKYFDIAVVDPPYFAGPNKRKYYGRSESTTRIKRTKYDVIDTWEIPGKEYFDELMRVSRHQIIWDATISTIISVPDASYGTSAEAKQHSRTPRLHFVASTIP